MEEDIRTLLEEQIAGEFGELATLATGSEEHKNAVDDLVKLYKLRIDEDKAAMEKREEESRRAQEAEEARHRYLKLGVEIAGIVLPLLFYGRWMRMGFRFEETGTFTSTTFRGLFNRFRPTAR